MRFNRALLLLPCLAACAASEGEYPSLALRPAELGQVAPAPAPDIPLPPSAEVLAQIEQLAGQSTAAHRAFLAELPRVRSAVEAARGSGPDGENWALAQVALSGLQATRSPATVALADIDRIYADAATGGTDVARIADTRSRVAAEVDEQDRAIDSLIRSLDE